MENLKDIKNKMDQFSASCKKIIASYDEDSEYKSGLKEIYKYMDYLSNSMYEYMSKLESNLYEHKDGHLPKLTAGQMEKLLESCGASGDYEIKKPTVYVSKTNKGISFLASCHGKENNK